MCDKISGKRLEALFPAFSTFVDPYLFQVNPDDVEETREGCVRVLPEPGNGHKLNMTRLSPIPQAPSHLRHDNATCVRASCSGPCFDVANTEAGNLAFHPAVGRICIWSMFRTFFAPKASLIPFQVSRVPPSFTSPPTSCCQFAYAHIKFIHVEHCCWMTQLRRDQCRREVTSYQEAYSTAKTPRQCSGSLCETHFSSDLPKGLPRVSSGPRQKNFAYASASLDRYLSLGCLFRLFLERLTVVPLTLEDCHGERRKTRRIVISISISSMSQYSARVVSNPVCPSRNRQVSCLG
jgi:hypothetical protein